MEVAAEALAAANPTPNAAASPLLLGSWALLYSGRSARLAAAAGFPTSGGGGPSLREALQATSSRLYSTFYQYVPVLAGNQSKSKKARNVQVLRPGRVDNVVTTAGGPLPLRICVSGSTEPVSCGRGVGRVGMHVCPGL